MEACLSLDAFSSEPEFGSDLDRLPAVQVENGWPPIVILPGNYRLRNTRLVASQRQVQLSELWQH